MEENQGYGEYPKFPKAKEVQSAGKPVAKMIGQDGNIFNLLGIARRALKEFPGAYEEMWGRVQQGDYDNALVVMMDYVDIE